MSLIENGKKPDGFNPCYVKCPICGKSGDYWLTAFNLKYNEEDFISCLSCKGRFRVRGEGFSYLKVIH